MHTIQHILCIASNISCSLETDKYFSLNSFYAVPVHICHNSRTKNLDFPVNKKPPVKQSTFSKALSEQVEK